MKLRQAYQSMQESYMQHGHADSDMNGSLNIQVSPQTRANRESPAKSEPWRHNCYRIVSDEIAADLRANAFWRGGLRVA